MNESIRPGDWLKFQVIKHGALVTEEGYVTADPDFPRHQCLWVGSHIVADSDGKQIGFIIVLAHTPADPDDDLDDPIDRVARAIAEADGNSRPGYVYVKLAEAVMAAGGAQ